MQNKVAEANNGWRKRVATFTLILQKIFIYKSNLFHHGNWLIYRCLYQHKLPIRGNRCFLLSDTLNIFTQRRCVSKWLTTWTKPAFKTIYITFTLCLNLWTEMFFCIITNSTQWEARKALHCRLYLGSGSLSYVALQCAVYLNACSRVLK